MGADVYAGEVRPIGEVAVRAVRLGCGDRTADVFDDFTGHAVTVEGARLRLTTGGLVYVLLPALIVRQGVAVALAGGREVWVRVIDPAAVDREFTAAEAA